MPDYKNTAASIDINNPGIKKVWPTDDNAGENIAGSRYFLRDFKTLLFTGSKGGCGCSFIANCIAAYIAGNKDKNIVLMDLNTGRKDSRIIFNISGDNVRDAGDIICEIEDIDLSVLNKIVTNLESSLNLVLPSLKFEKNIYAFSENICGLVKALSKVFDLIILDFPYHLFFNINKDFLEIIDKLVCISLGDFISISNLNTLLKNLCAENKYIQFEIIINKFNLKPAVGAGRINSFLDYPVKTFIPYDRDIEFLYMSRGPFSIFNYNLRIVRAIREFSDYIYEDLFD